ncbi:MAG: chromosome segregation ATPase [Nostocaceae cyanobacterium]|nr:chromosome segregation ATPase [Nostocaceae cyanobacterium]
MAEQDIPESWSADKSTDPNLFTRLSGVPQISDAHRSGVSSPGSNYKSVNRATKNYSDKNPVNKQSKKTVSSANNSGRLPRWTKSWVPWTILLALLPGSIGFMATAMLLKLPSAPNCPSIFWPLASASVRLHCAQLAASKATVGDLLQAISLVRQLPESHPLHEEIERYMEEWSQDILNLADESFQGGKLTEAIKTARQIPKDVSAYKLVEERIADWQLTWSEAEGIYAEVEDHLREERWQQAFMEASRLLRVDNKYWATTKYEQLDNLITTTREDGEKLAQAKNLGKRRNADDLLKAIKLADSIGQNSYVFSKAQEVIPEFGRKMLELAEAKLERKDADEAIAIAQEIPGSTGLEAEKEDFIILAEAQRSAWIGTISGLESAIWQAQQVDPSRPIYEKAQQLIAGWQLEIEDVARLEKARLLASQGTVGDLTAAIAEAELIPVSNPRSREAKKEIGRWATQIQTIEDKPYLDRAEQIAVLGDINSLQAAITEASQIRRGRVLYREARRKIATWTNKIQRIQDLPYLEQARSLARSGDLNSAIATAQQISNGRALSREAKKSINQWQEEINAKGNWSKARQIALAGTPNALAEAMRVANRVPRSNVLRIDANIAIDQWSQQLLQIARSQGESNMSRAIKTAKLIPRGSVAYSEAREQIRTWQRFLKPLPEESQVVSTPKRRSSSSTIRKRRSSTIRKRRSSTPVQLQPSVTPKPQPSATPTPKPVIIQQPQSSTTGEVKSKTQRLYDALDSQ